MKECYREIARLNWGEYNLTEHFIERLIERFGHHPVTINNLRLDFLKHERRKRYRVVKQDRCIIGKVGIYFIDKDREVLKTVVEKNERNIFITNNYK